MPRPEAGTEILTDLDHLPASADLLAILGAQHLAPVVYAVRAYGCRVAVIRPHGRFAFVGSAPIVGIVGDDRPRRSLGPDGFSRKSMMRFLGTCRAAAIVSSGAETLPYAIVAGVALLTRKNTVVIETQPEHEAAWAETVRRAQPNAQLVICRPRPH